MPRACWNGFSCRYKPRCHFDHPEDGNFVLSNKVVPTRNNAEAKNVDLSDKYPRKDLKVHRPARKVTQKTGVKPEENVNIDELDIDSLKKMNIDKLDKKILLNIENLIADDWDVIKEEETSLEKIFGRREVFAEKVKVEIKEKTIELGAARNYEELAIETFTFKLDLEDSVVKAYRISLFEKYDSDDEEDVEISPKKSSKEVDTRLVNKKVSKDRKENLKTGAETYLIFHKLTEKNKERMERKLNRIQGPMFQSLIDGTWEPFKEETEPNFSVKVKDWVAFGDFWDAKKQESVQVTPAPGSTINFNVNTVRRFVPGVYRVSVITLKEEYEFRRWNKKTLEAPLVIFHHESVSPRKIGRMLLLTTDTPDYDPEVANSINRYDWFHGAYWGHHESGDDGSSDDDEDEKGYYDHDDSDEEIPEAERRKEWGYSLYRRSKAKIVYFTPVTNSSAFAVGVKKGFQKESANIRGVHQIYGPTEMIKKRSIRIAANEKFEKVSLGVDMRVVDKGEEWEYGVLLENEDTNTNFALVAFSSLQCLRHFELDVPEAFEKETFYKDQHNLKFKMKDFVYSE